MKKTLILLSTISLSFLACKKDRECACRTVVTTQVGSAPSTDVVYDETYIMKETTLRTAFNGCVHTKEVETSGNITTTRDVNCELK